MSFPLGGERDSEGERKEAVRKMKVPKPRGLFAPFLSRRQIQR